MAKVSLTPESRLIMLRPAALVTCAAGGKSNIITVAMAGSFCWTPAMLAIGISLKRYSWELIKASGEFIVNLAREEQMQAVDLCGAVSGREVDKWALTGLTPAPARAVAAPMILECPVNLECRVSFSRVLGTHEIFAGEMVAAQADESVLDGAGRIDPGKLGLLACVGAEYWDLGRRLESHGFSRRQSK